MNDKLTDKVARVALAIQRGQKDHIGDVDTIHQDFMAILQSIIDWRNIAGMSIMLNISLLVAFALSLF